MGWILYAIAVLAVSGLIGMHLGRFREAYTEMTGMMAGMTMGMLNGFVLGFAAAAAATSAFEVSNTYSLFWGNIVGILLGIALGAYFGRAGGLMGVMDGSMGGVMGGSMGAMLAAMLTFPEVLLFWMAIVLSIVYLVGMAGLVVLIERSAPGHAALHRLAPMFTRAMATEAQEEAEIRSRNNPRIADYYLYLGVPRTASEDAITDAYLMKLAASDEAGLPHLERALAILTDRAKRRAYDSTLGVSARADCCPPPRAKKATGATTATRANVASSVETRKTSAVAVVERPGQISPVVSSEADAPSKRIISKTAPVAAKATSSSKNGAHAKQKQPHSQPQGAASRTGRKKPARQRVGVNGPLLGGLAVLLLLGLFAVWQLAWGLGAQTGTNRGGTMSASGQTAYTDTGAQLPPEFIAKVKSESVAATVGTDGRQTLDLVVNGDTMSYKPNSIKVKQGVPVHFNLRVEGSDPGCGRFVGIRGLGVHGTAEPGEVNSMDFTPTQAGVFQINCNMLMMEPGYLVVTQ